MADITELAQRLKLEVHRAVSNFNPQMNIKARDLKELVEAMEKAQTINAAAEKLVRCKGRYHSEQNYRALATLFGVTTPDLPQLDSESRTVKLPVSLDFDCEMENGDYDIDEEPYLRGKVDGFNYALTKVRRLNGAAGIKWEAE